MAILPQLNQTFGIFKQNNITMKTITDITNITTDPSELLGNINQAVYGGNMFFAILVTAAIIGYMSLQQWKAQPLVNSMYISTICGILGFILRAIEINGNGLINSYQMWIFPIIAILLAAILKSIED